MDEAKKVLEMIEQGQITAAEGMELLEALKSTDTVEVEEIVPATPVRADGTKDYQFLRVRVMSENGETKVKVNIPISLIKALGSLANLEKMIPDSANADVSGFDFKSIDIDAILKAIEDGTMGDGTIVDVEALDEKGNKIWVKVYVD